MKNNSKQKKKKNYRSSLVKESLGKNPARQIYDKKNLNRIIKHLTRINKKERNDTELKKSCLGVETSEVRTDTQVKLRCHQLPNVVQELRRALIRQDWDEAVTLLMILCHPGLKLYTSVILRTCCVLFFNHPKSNFQLIQDFIRLITGYILEEDVNKFIRILFALRKSAVTFPEGGKKISEYKVTRDFEFENL